MNSYNDGGVKFMLFGDIKGYCIDKKITKNLIHKQKS